MKRTARGALLLLIAYALTALGCMDRRPAPMCPVPTEVTLSKKMATSFDGVDMLVVVDNSGSMEQEQAILATGFYTLINSLVNPLQNDPHWPYPKVENMRIAVISSDLGLQYGENGSTEGFPYGMGSKVPCKEKKGDDGEFLLVNNISVNVSGGQIRCEPGGNQCPADWTCDNLDEDGLGNCNPRSGAAAEPVNCPSISSGQDWAETRKENENTLLATQVACMGRLGKEGCGIEQQLEAPIKALSKSSQAPFMVDSHLLAIMVVSDEEDCSVKDKGLFFTPEWESGTTYDPSDSSKGLLNTACNLPEKNEDYLFETSRYWAQFVELKGGQANAVVFGAIVGVPTGDDSPCQGSGQAIRDANCKDDPRMGLSVELFDDSGEYLHFRAACTREENGNKVTEARPGRRYVKVAEDFGANGYVYSICNEDWSPAMKDIARVIAENMGSQCYTKPLEWSLAPEAERANCGNGNDCGRAKCDVVITYSYPPDEVKGCPAALNVDPERISQESVKDSDGKVMRVNVSCPLPKLLAPLDCNEAETMFGDNKNTVGWYYCEDHRENFEDACDDDLDNDDDGSADCDDDGCAPCKVACGGTGVGCEQSCKYGVELTRAAKDLAQGSMVEVQCLQEFSFEDENCQENTALSCKDNQDNDGNGVWDCNEVTKGDTPHRPDKNCCPMYKNDAGKCVLGTVGNSNKPAVLDNCPGSSMDNLPDACKSAETALECSW